MKQLATIFLILFATSNLFAQNKKIKVLVLGTIHFFAMNGDSVTSPKKSKELNEILLELKKFNPDQILMEFTPENDRYLDPIYKDYHEFNKQPTGDYAWLLNNEYYQIGVRLSSMLNLPNAVKGIDWNDPDIRDSLRTFNHQYEKSYFDFVKEIRKYAMSKKFVDADSAGNKILTTIQKELSPYWQISPNVSLRQMYKVLNKPENLKKGYYTNRLGNLLLNAAEVGAELSSVESFRDLKIFRNALNRIDQNTKRILIVYGVSHAHILREYFNLDPRFEVVNVDTVIK